MTPSFKRIVVFAKSAYGTDNRDGRAGPPDPSVVAACRRVMSVASDFGVRIEAEKSLASALGEPPAGPSRAPGASSDLVLSLGGDGTLLRAARSVWGSDVPVLGINMGNLGFLASVAANQIESGLRRVLKGEFQIEERRTLEAEVVPEGDREAKRFAVLNDVVVHKAGAARVTRLDLWVGQGDAREEIGSFSGDGVILSTPTGSTAYSLSAGGPIIVPELNCFLVTPILPHTLAVRPLVVPGGEEITVTILDRGEPLYLTADGQEGSPLTASDRVVVRMGAARIPLVRLPEHSFFATLRRKLNWAVNPPEGS